MDEQALIQYQQALKSREQWMYAVFATGGAIAGWLIARKIAGKDWTSLGGLIGSVAGATVNYLRVSSSQSDTTTLTTQTVV